MADGNGYGNGEYNGQGGGNGVNRRNTARPNSNGQVNRTGMQGRGGSAQRRPAPGQPANRSGQPYRGASIPPHSAAPRRGYGTVQRRRRRRRPTAFVLLLAVFIILLLIIIFTSKSCKNFMEGLGGDETQSDTSSDSTSADETSVDTTEASASAEDTTDDTASLGSSSEPDEEGIVSDDGVFTICIDPGHGFEDTGASSDYLGGLYESDINLLVAKAIYDIIAADGYNVILTHDGTTFPISSIDDGNYIYNIVERSYYANTQDVDLFVSIHCDSYTDSGTSGARIYYCSNYTYATWAAQFAASVASAINSTTLSSNTVNYIGYEMGDAYYVTAHLNCPSILIELGFVSNESDAEKLLDEQWRAEMSAAIAEAVESYANSADWE
ncbi:MAG: N-acetylmuramoyl-L-alanine amidase [Firmicutes bacterium]|nr:N-acetylmuramoyl-L-alanine amidase [Bacillota bacterium]MCD7830927.1 N-acetylmuramoyl-L-alanine amidase [Bacillota bacterium]